jgi:hypothetical protein
MAHDVFLSYASTDKPAADAIVAALEGRRVRCWIAPRDVPAGSQWPATILNAISTAKAMIVVLSVAANASPQVVREVERAVNKGLVIIPFRLDGAPLSESLEFLVSSCHCLDATTPPIEQHIARLVDEVCRVLIGEGPATTTIGGGQQLLRSSYRLGFTAGKLAWHSGSPVELATMKEQARTFMGELAVPSDVVIAVLGSFDSAKSPGDLVQNAKRGLTTRNAMSSLLATRNGEASAAAFRLGFGIVNLMPQFEFLEMGENAGLPWAELAGPMQDQIESLTHDGQLAGVDPKSVAMLQTVAADPKKAKAARGLLVMLGGAVDTSLGQAAG